LAIALLLSSVSVADPYQWVEEVGGNGHYYELIFEVVTFDIANEIAAGMSYEGLQGHLATVTSSEENDAICAYVAPNECWIGGYQVEGSEEPGEGWRWVTEEPWEYENWATGEPNDAQGGENELTWWPGCNWNDGHGWDTMPSFLVEYEENPVAVESLSWSMVKIFY